LKTSLEKTPENARALYNLGIVYVKEARLDEARETLEKSIKLDARADPITVLGQVYLCQGDFPQAIESYQRAVKLRPDQYDAWGNLALAYRDSGQHSKEAAEAFQKAIALAQQAMKNTPEDPYVVSVLGRYYASVGDEPHAGPLLRKAVALAPKDPEVVERVAEAYEALGKRDLALNFLGKALQLGFSVPYAKASPTLKSLRSDPNAPPSIRETGSTEK
jgi:tetratricopeptide (TPR) repeat protein